MERAIECVDGNNIELSCAVLEDNALAVWMKNGVVIQQSAKFKIEAIGMMHKLSIMQADKQDVGEYTVTINNRKLSSSLQVKEIPAAIQQLSEKDKGLYLEIIKAGTETRYYIRILIVGENGVGKTCLLRRLLGETIDDVESTDGVDIVHRCKIRLSDGHWIFDGVSDKRKALLSRIRRAVNSKTFEDVNIQDKLNSQSDALVAAGSKLNKHTKSHLRKRRKSRQTSKVIGNVTEVIESVPDNERGVIRVLKSKDASSQSIPVLMKKNLIERKNEKVLNETILNDLSEFLNDIENIDIPDEILVDCGFWDFAGQRHYYATHPIFLNPNAVHLLVANIMKDIKQITTENGFDKIGEYVDFWFDSVHSCRYMETKTENSGNELHPPVIVVCTGIDNCEGNLEERKTEFRQQLNSLLDNEDKRNHLRRICWVSNTKPSDKDFDHVRQSIFQFGKEMKTCGEKLPLKWIQLERLLDVIREAGVNILSWPDMTDLSSKCLIHDEKEIMLFLKYQHKVGSIIYFQSLKENIILNQKWLADAFRCFVSDKFESDITLTLEWKMLEDTGKLEPVLIEQLFQKDPHLEFYKHQKHLLNVMELFGIIVKVTTLLEDGQTQHSSSFYMPCMISKHTSIVEITKVFRVEEENCKRTPWLCMELKFMPFDFFNHIICYYISKYPICTEPKTKRVAIYHGMGVFDLDKTRSRKFILFFSKNTVAIQLWQWKKIEQAEYKRMMEELKSVILRLKDKYESRKVSYILKLKCCEGNIHNSDGRLSYIESVELGDEEYFCEDHSMCHNTNDFFQTWFAEYSENEDSQSASRESTGMQDTRFKQKCHFCDEEPSVYWCHDCQRSMCQDCKNREKSTHTLQHIVQHVQDVYSMDYNFNINVEVVRDIKVLHNDILVLAYWYGQQLVTCNMTGQQQNTIPIPGRPRRIAVVDSNTVAVTLRTNKSFKHLVIIVDVGQKKVIHRIDVKVLCYGILYRDNQLFVGCDDRTIKVMNMSLDETRTIPVGATPRYICGGETGRIYYTDHDKLYCIDTAGNTLFTFTHPTMKRPQGITTDDEAHLLVISDRSNNVLRISPDGKHSQVIITHIPSLSSSDWFPDICYNSLSKSVVIIDENTVYVYKKV